MRTNAERGTHDAQIARNSSLSVERMSGEELLQRGLAVRNQPLPGRLVEIGAEVGIVYAIQTTEPASPVKIGYTTAGGLTDRVASLQTGNPSRLFVIAQAPGYLSHEQRAHKVLTRYRLTGEWFEWCPRVAAFIKALRLDGTEAAIAAAKLAKDRP
jgi:hypothetical protein